LQYIVEEALEAKTGDLLGRGCYDRDEAPCGVITTAHFGPVFACEVSRS